MAYTIVKTDGTILVTVSDNTINSSKTTIQLIGRGFPNYGDELNTNMVHLMEHFANTTAPLNQIIGQIWMDTTADVLKYWDGTQWNALVFTTPGSEGAIGGNIIGEIKILAGSSVPTGWVECDGTAISRTTYATLFATIGTTYGVGDGATTFNVPDSYDGFNYIIFTGVY